MIQGTRMRNWLIASLVLCLVIGRDAQAARKLYLITVADTKDATIGEHAASDISSVHNAFYGSVAKSELVLVPPVKDRQATEKGLLAAINRLNPAREDAVLVYYSGHGAHQKDNQHYLVTQNSREWIGRKKVVDAMQAKGFGLVVLLTDSCYNFSTKPPAVGAPFIQPPEVTLPLYKALFFRNNGVIDVNSAKQGQVAGTYPEQGAGSIFTHALCSTLVENENNGSMAWTVLLDKVDESARTTFRQLYPDGHQVETQNGLINQREQRLTKLALSITPYTPEEGDDGGGDGPPAGNAIASVRLGLTVRNHDGAGVLVTAVAKGGPATKCLDSNDGRTYYLEAGDAITSINDVEITDINDFANEVRNSNKSMTFTAQGVGGDVHTFTTQLNPLNGGGGNPGGNQGTRFGAYIATRNGRVQVTGTVADSPSTRCLDANGQSWRLEAGDIIRAVNGQAVSTEQEFRQAVSDSPREMTLEVRGTDGKFYQFTSTLNY